MNANESLSGPAVETFQRLAVHAASTALNQMHHGYQNFTPPLHFREAQESFVGIIPFLKKVIYYFFVGSFLLVTSMATYGLFYLAVMPANAATENLYFDYSCQSRTTTSTNETVCPVNATVCSAKAIHQDPCTPKAIVDIFAKHSPWEALHPDVIPEPRSKSGILRPRKQYFLEVVLQLPESITNQDVGMFAVEVELQTAGHVPLARSHRSARLPHESSWISVVRKSLCLAPLIVGAMTESRTVFVPSFRHFVESSNHPLQHVVVSLGSQGTGWRRKTPVEVIAAELRIGKELNGFQSILKEWFWTSFLIGTFMIMMFQALLFFLAAFIWDSWRESLRTEQVEDVDLGDTPYFFDSTPTQSEARDGFEDDESQWEPTSPQEPGVIAVEEPAPDTTASET